jgi:hypothetical protein
MSKSFDGDRAIASLGKPYNAPDVIALLREAGYTGTYDPEDDTELELKKAGLVFSFHRKIGDTPMLSEVRFEKKFAGRLPHGIAATLPRGEANTVLAAVAERIDVLEDDNDWVTYYLPTHEVTMRFGKKQLDAIFLCAKSD